MQISTRGSITEAEAGIAAKNIEREADFYGAMDGASKFVKGDAIALNAHRRHQHRRRLHYRHGDAPHDLAEAASTYTLLSVGDGLVSQIPALLLSTATGLMVTRAASEVNLGADVVTQLFAQPRTLYIVSGAIVLLGIGTPIGLLRTVPSLPLRLTWDGANNANKADAAKAAEANVRTKTDDTKKPESVLSSLSVDPIEFEFGYGLIPIVDAKQGGDLLDRVVMIRRQLALELGLVVPVIRLRDNIQLRPSDYAIKIRGVEVAGGELMMGHYLAMSPGVDDPKVVGVPTEEPTFGMPALWIDASMRPRAEAAGYTVVDPPTVVATHLTEVLKRHAHELLGRQETKALLDYIKSSAPAVVEDLVPNTLTIGQVQRVLSNLLQEKVSIRDLVTILETLADVGATTKDTDALTEQVRQALARHICHQFRIPGEPLSVITFAPPVEARVQESLVDGFIGVEPAVAQDIYKRLREEVGKLSALGKTPILLTHPQLRLPLRRWLMRLLPDLVVLSYSELDPSVEVESKGVVNL